MSAAPPRACYTFPLEVQGSFEDAVLSATSWSQKDKDCMIHFYEMPRETGRRMVVSRGCGREGSHWLMGTQFLFGKMEKICGWW